MKLSTFEMSYVFSDQLHEQNVQAVAHSNGVLNELVQICSPTNTSTGITDQEEYLSHLGNVVTFNTVCDETGYPAAVTTLVDQLAPLVTSHISHARNVVVPLVKGLAENYQHYLESAKIKDPTTMFEICKVKLPSILVDESFLTDLGYARSANKNVPSEYLRLDAKSPEDLLDMVMTGSARHDEQIKALVMSKGLGWLEQVWFGIFGKSEYLADKNFCINGYTSLENGICTPQELAEISLVVYLFARKLQMNVPEGVNMSLRKFDDLITAIKDYAAVNLTFHLRKCADANTTKTLVMQYNEGTYCMYINDDLYGEWLDQGNSPEILLGMVCTGNYVKTIPEINERAEQYKKAWDNFVALHHAKEVNNRHVYARKALISLFNEQLQKEIPEEKEVRLKESNFIDTRIKKAYEFIDGMSVTQLDDTFNVALHLVARIRFDYTSAFYILKDIDAVCKANPNIDVREAANLATINYIGDYLADQIAIKTL